MLKEFVMLNRKFNWIGTGTISALAVAGTLMLGNGIVFAAQTEPAPAPPKTTQLIRKPAVAPARPAPQPARPSVQPPLRPQVPPARTNPQPGIRPEPTRTTPPMRPATPKVEPPRTPVRTVPRPVVEKGTGRPVVPANAQRTRLPNGGEAIRTGDGRVLKTNSKGQLSSVTTRSGAEAHFTNGRLSTLHHVAPDGTVTDIHRSPTGVSTIKTVSRDPYGHTVRTVSDGHRGYRERDLLRRPGYKERTYFANGHTRVAIYHEQTFGRYGAYPVYVPAYTYSPGFYAYAGTPWGAGVAYGWTPVPVYGGYFVPPPAYSSPNAWMADYMINQNLQNNAAQQQDAQADAASGEQAEPGVAPAGVPSGTQGDAGDPQAAQPEPIPQSVRDTYAIQVQASIQKAQAQAAGQPAPQDVPPALDPQHTTFQSYSDTEATDGNGQECALTGGDFVERQEAAPDAQKTILVKVVAVAKPSSSHCGKFAMVRISMEVLVDWSNAESEQLAAGEQALAENAGKNGFPPAPPSGQTPNPAGQGTPDDTTAVASAIQQQQAGSSALISEVGGGQ
jgi:hypothetical protein